MRILYFPAVLSHLHWILNFCFSFVDFMFVFDDLFPILSGLVNSFFIDFVDLLPQDLLELSDLLHRILSTCLPVLECFVECCGVVMTWSLHLVASCCNMFEESASVFNKNVSKNIGNILQHCSLAPRHMLATWPLSEQCSEFHFIF